MVVVAVIVSMYIIFKYITWHGQIECSDWPLAGQDFTIRARHLKVVCLEIYSLTPDKIKLRNTKPNLVTSAVRVGKRVLE